MTVTNQRLVEILTTAMEKPEIANALIQRVINTLNRQAQREWQGLTDEEIGEIIEASQITLKNYCSEDKQIEFARAIEAKLRRKNEQPCLF